MSSGPTVVDLYCGAGGFGLGAELAGFHSLAAIDIDETLQSAYRLNFPNTHAIQADVGQLTQSAWRFLLKDRRPDGVIGGPPCQGFSRIGKRDNEDPRNTLISKFFEQVGYLDPKFFIMENVEGLLDERTVDILYSSLEPIARRYTVLDPMIIKASDYGAPTTRTRVVVVGYRPDELDTLTIGDFAPPKSCRKVKAGQAIEDLSSPIAISPYQQQFVWGGYRSDKSFRLSQYAKRMRRSPKKGLGWATALKQLANGLVSGFSDTSHSEAVAQRFQATSPGTTEKVSRYPKLHPLEFCPTLRAGTGSDKGSFQAMRPIHYRAPRVITVREAARLQGFPDWFVFHPAKWHSFRMIGNSVSPIVSQKILKVINQKFSLKKAA
ncbi:DNA cytosine methyltransferase [Eilatimonas milleporae]|uniref:Cytosine-specific methyltransferase n=1 Tax=Eilatimonas milleporae TaxID=911205 RepID=A0A3M0CGJ5_9PROT|nr:DNA cytosine methyltransferase [Eilatimonas milleporae]RMB08105.1 DNA (cytosine-5)-methyltransferase 1 [Eilatimonas milleporae]